MNSSDMREVWKRLGDKGRVLYGGLEMHWQWAQHGKIVNNYFCDFGPSAMQGCKL